MILEVLSVIGGRSPLKVWPNAEIFMFEANEDLKEFYEYYGWE